MRSKIVFKNLRVNLLCHISLSFDNYNMPDKHLYENKEKLRVYFKVKLGCLLRLILRLTRWLLRLILKE